MKFWTPLPYFDTNPLILYEVRVSLKCWKFGIIGKKLCWFLFCNQNWRNSSKNMYFGHYTFFCIILDPTSTISATHQAHMSGPTDFFDENHLKGYIIYWLEKLFWFLVIKYHACTGRPLFWFHREISWKYAHRFFSPACPGFFPLPTHMKLIFTDSAVAETIRSINSKNIYSLIFSKSNK